MLSPKTRSYTKRCLRNYAFSNHIERFLRKSGVKLSVFAEKRGVKRCAFAVYSIFRQVVEFCILANTLSETVRFSPKTRSEMVRFWRQRGIRDNSFMQENLNLNFKNFKNSGPWPCLFLNDVKKVKNKQINLKLKISCIDKYR